MVAFTAVVLSVSALVASAYAEPINDDTNVNFLAERQSTPQGTGTSNGYFYSYYDSGSSGTQFVSKAGGEYSLTWGSGGNVVAGKGWNPGSATPIVYSGTYSPNGNSYLSVYGWFTNPLVEYYIMENYGTYNPASSLTHKGTVTSDGGTYDIYEGVRTNEPSIVGTSTFNQYWSIRQTKRTGGTVTVANHFNAWAAVGMPSGTFNYQILATEAYYSTGSSDITVGHGTASTTSVAGTTTTSIYSPPPSTTSHSSPPTTTSTASGASQTKYGQCGGNGWTGPTVCASGSTCKAVSPPYYSQCL